jgi:hypothetical protein
MENRMQILIHTYGRADPKRQHTLMQLTEADIWPTLVVQHREKDMYEWYDGGVYVLPEDISTLTPTRDHLIHDMEGPDRVVFLDDDLHFAVRREDDRTKFRQPQPTDIQRMFQNVSDMLSHVPHVGIGAREGGNRNTEKVLMNTRIMRVLAYSRRYLRENHITFSPLVVMEDFHVNLQILRSGADTVVLNDYVSNQAGGSNAPGGCSHYRSDAVQTAAAHMLAARHPGFVRVAQKATKAAWGGGTRTDVVVQWKAARRSVP